MQIPDQRASVVGLLVPADRRRPVEMLSIKLAAVALSDAIGGGLLDEAWHGSVDGHGFTFYLDEHRTTKDLPGNDRACVLSARLGRIDRQWLADLRGDLLVLGRDDRHDDTDAPVSVIAAARRSGLLTDGRRWWTG